MFDTLITVPLRQHDAAQCEAVVVLFNLLRCLGHSVPWVLHLGSTASN